jgi:hypothetical protein
VDKARVKPIKQTRKVDHRQATGKLAEASVMNATILMADLKKILLKKAPTVSDIFISSHHYYRWCDAFLSNGINISTLLFLAIDEIFKV